MPRDLARFATLMSIMSRTITSQDGHAARCTISMTSVQAAQPALNTSIFRFVAIAASRYRMLRRTYTLARLQHINTKRRAGSAHESFSVKFNECVPDPRTPGVLIVHHIGTTVRTKLRLRNQFPNTAMEIFGRCDKMRVG